MAATLLLLIVIVIFSDMSFIQGTPTIDLVRGNTVVEEYGLAVRGTTTQCYSSLPTFTWDLVSIDGSIPPVQLSGDPVTATSGGSCSGGSSFYTGIVTVNYYFPSLYGQTVHLRLTINNNPSTSTTSIGTLSFLAKYNLTGTSDIAVLGKQFTWTCKMEIPSQESHALVRFYRNETFIGYVGNVTGCKGLSIDPRYNYSCTSETEYNLIIPSENMTEEENNTIWRCSYFGGSPSFSSVQKQLIIGKKPEVHIMTPSPYKVEESETAVMSCGIITATPNTGIIWSWAKTDGPENILHDGSTYTISSIQRGQSGTYECIAKNIIGTSLPATVQVDVLYKPEVSINSTHPYRVTEGQVVLMTCSMLDANPSSDITWSWIKADSPSNILHQGSTYTISNIQRNQTGMYRCTARNSIGTSNPATIQVDVQYKPEVKITPLNPYRVKESTPVVMSCIISTANPNIDIRWSWIKKDNPDNIIHTGSTYEISNIQRDQSGTYRCTATNSIGTSNPALLQVDVQYAPSLVTFSPDIVTINKLENQTVSPIMCSAVCNPTCTYRWTGVSTVNSARLDLGELKRTKRGNYTCTASNAISSSSRSLVVTVNYPPNIEIFQASGDQVYEESSQFSIMCKVDSYPLSNIHIENKDIGKVISSSGPIESLLFNEISAKCYQTSNYTCNSRNFYGSTSSNILGLFIICRPRPLDGKSTIITGIQKGKGLNISTKFVGYPLPTISWKFKTNISDMLTTVSSEFKTFSEPLNVSTIQTSLTKMDVLPEEFGYYIVTASTPGNISQNHSVTYHVIPERKPDAPSNISLDCAISNGRAFIEWIPGFNGGVDQTFVVSYRSNTGLQKNTAQIHLQSYATVTGLKDQTLYFFKVIASNRNGETSSVEVHCTTKESTVSNIGGTIGGIAGSIFLLIVIALFILIIRKYQIKCLERVPNLRKKKTKVSRKNSDLKGQENDERVHYEELKAVCRDGKKNYDVIQSAGSKSDENIIEGYESLDLQHQKEENNYEVLENIEDCKDPINTESETRTSADVYINE